MTAAHSSGVWSPALARGLIREEDSYRSSGNPDLGFIDLLGPHVRERRSLAQRAMHNPAVAAIYERLWRPVAIGIMSLHGISVTEERQRAAWELRIHGEQRVLDVACGPGNFTGYLADRLTGDGFAIGLDVSAPMLERAVRDNCSPRAVYVRADACRLPFDDGVFDAVCCFAALYLMPDPIRAVDEMLRVLAPRGRIALLTSYGREGRLTRAALELGARVCGVRLFDRHTIPAALRTAGMRDVDQRLRGLSQFVTATR